MPNWCSNVISIENRKNDPELNSYLQRLNEEFEDEAPFNFIIPMPDVLKDSTRPPKDKEDEERNIQITGFRDWYDWSVENWGTKWEPSNAYLEISDDSNLLEGSFDTAWSPPYGILNKLKEMGFWVSCFYYDEFLNFYGKWEDGFQVALNDEEMEIINEIKSDFEVDKN